MVVRDGSLGLLLTLGGEHCLSRALNRVGYAVELASLTSVPQVGDLYVAALAVLLDKLVGNDGVAAACSGEACGLGEGADLDCALLSALNEVNASRKVCFCDERFVSRVEDDDCVVCERVVHPFPELRLGVNGACGVVRGAEVDKVSLDVLWGHCSESVLLGGVCVNYGVAAHDVAVYVNRVSRVGDYNGVTLAEDVDDVAAVALCAVADVDNGGVNVSAEALVIVGNSLAQEVVACAAVLVAAEGLLDAHFL